MDFCTIHLHLQMLSILGICSSLNNMIKLILNQGFKYYKHATDQMASLFSSRVQQVIDCSSSMQIKPIQFKVMVTRHSNASHFKFTAFVFVEFTSSFNHILCALHSILFLFLSHNTSINTTVSISQLSVLLCLDISYIYSACNLTILYFIDKYLFSVIFL